MLGARCKHVNFEAEKIPVSTKWRVQIRREGCSPLLSSPSSSGCRLQGLGCMWKGIEFRVSLRVSTAHGRKVHEAPRGRQRRPMYLVRRQRQDIPQRPHVSAPAGAPSGCAHLGGLKTRLRAALFPCPAGFSQGGDARAGVGFSVLCGHLIVTPSSPYTSRTIRSETLCHAASAAPPGTAGVSLPGLYDA